MESFSPPPPPPPPPQSRMLFPSPFVIRCRLFFPKYRSEGVGVEHFQDANVSNAGDGSESGSGRETVDPSPEDDAVQRCCGWTAFAGAFGTTGK